MAERWIIFTFLAQGNLKGELVKSSLLPEDVQTEVSKQLGWEIAEINPNFDINDLCQSDDDEDSSEGWNSGTGEQKQEEEFREPDVENAIQGFRTKLNLGAESSAYCGLVDRLNNLDDEDLEEMTSRISSGLKSWLNFGMTIAKNPNLSFGSSATSETHSKLKERWKGEEANAESNKNAGLIALEKSGKGSAAITAMAKGDDKLTRKAEEQATKISTEFCCWLKELPPGLDETVNNTTPDQVKALFDTSAKTQDYSMVRKGINSWVSFGLNIRGAPKVMDIATIVKQQICKVKFKKQFDTIAVDKKKSRKRSIKGGTRPNIRREHKQGDFLDHRKYGAWYLKPTDWEERFKKLNGKSSSVNAITSGRKLLKQKNETKVTSAAESGDAHLTQLYSTRAFAEFLQKRPNYRPPSFMADILPASDEQNHAESPAKTT